MEGNIQKEGGSFAQRGRANEEAYFAKLEREKILALQQKQQQQQQSQDLKSSLEVKGNLQQDSQNKK
ncbi:hypothetical protein K7432_017323 [Basidiobolus ranarum]|uniref:ATPase inhibitor, mitochondrial n=1 Tax=Basidiobolus ranarum TaxID=34480 RepID=A0ABR2WDH2_9FUNG